MRKWQVREILTNLKNKTSKEIEAELRKHVKKPNFDSGLAKALHELYKSKKQYELKMNI